MGFDVDGDQIVVAVNETDANDDDQVVKVVIPS